MSQLFKLVQSEKLRTQLDKQQQKRISSLYQEMAKDIKNKSKQLEGRTNISSTLRLQYMKQMEKELKTAFVESEKKIGNEIKKNMQKISETVVKDNDKWMQSIGMPNGGALLNVPKDIIEKIITGKLYDGDWTLSQALWKDVIKKQSDINEVIAKGIAENKSAYDIAKDLEKYVDPKARKDWKWSKVYPGTNKKIDYSAQRLARTAVSHAYQQSIVDTTKPNPFVEGLEWRATGGERMCSICADRDGTVYKKGDLPLDHPNGMCTFIAVIMDDDIISNRLANWVKGGEDKELDKWSNTLGNKSQEKSGTYKEYNNNTQQESDRIFKLMYKNGIEKGQAEAVYNYTGDSYKAINNYLRKGKILSSDKGGSSLSPPKIKEATQKLNNLFSQSKLSENLTLFRGVSEKAIGKFEVGKILSDKGFLSTSIDKDIALGFMKYSDNGVVLKVRAPSGTPVLPATSINKEVKGYSWLNEAEMLLSSEQKLKMVSERVVTLSENIFNDHGGIMFEKGYKYREILMEVIP